MNVLLPQPEGPITAVIMFLEISRLTSLIGDVRAVARRQSLDLEDRLARVGRRLVALGDVDRPHRGHRNRPFSSVIGELPAGAGEREAREQARDQHERHQHERRGPGARVVVGSGDSELLKIVERDGLQRVPRVPADWLVVIEHVKSSGAVSPAARAIASIAPVRIPPRLRRQDDADDGAPAADAERESSPRAGCWARARAPPASTRAISGSMMIASATPAAYRALLVAEDEQAEDEDADHDRRQAVQDVEHEPDRRGASSARRELARVDRDQDAERQRDRRRERDDHDRADDRVRDPAAGLAEAAGTFVKKSSVSALAPRCDRRSR